jgi:hypothetical protein
MGLNAASQFVLSGCNLIGIESLTSRSIEADVLAGISLYWSLIPWPDSVLCSAIAELSGSVSTLSRDDDG